MHSKARPAAANAAIGLLVYATLVVCLVLSTLASASATETLDRVTLQLKWSHQFQFAGYYAAAEKGFFADEGLDVVLHEPDAERTPLQEVLSGRAQYGITDTGLVLAALQGDPVVLVAQLFQHSPLVLLTRQTDGIRGPYDLDGKRVSVDDTGLTGIPILEMLRDALGGLGTVDIQPQLNSFDDLAEGRIDALAAYRSLRPFVFQQRGLAVTPIDPRDYGINFYGDNLFTNYTELSANPGRVERMRRATLRGWEYALNHPDEIIEVILDRYNSQGLTREQLEYEAREIAEVVLKDFIPLGSYIPERFTKIAETYAKNGFVTQTSLPDRFFYQSLKHSLTEEETRYLEGLRLLRIGVTSGQPPLTILQDEVPQGFLNDLFRQVADLLDLRYEWAPQADQLSAMQALGRGDIALMTNVSTGADSAFSMLKSEAVLRAPFVVVGRPDLPAVTRMSDLADKRLALVEGFQQTWTIQQRYPAIDVELVGSINEAYRALRSGSADYYVDNATHAGYFLRQSMASDLEIRGELPKEEVGQLSMHFGIQRDQPMLASLVDKALDAIGQDGMQALRAKWLAPLLSRASDGPSPLVLTPEQQRWLKQHPRIEIGVNDSWPPFGLIGSDDNLEGIGKDLIDALNRRLNGVLVPRPGAWRDLYDSVAARELPALLDLTPRPSRLDDFAFTTPYLEIPHVFVARKNEGRFNTEQDLDKKIVALEAGFGNVEHFRTQYPAVTIREYPDTAAALDAVSRGEADAYAGNRAVASYLIRRELFVNLELQGRLSHEGSLLAIGTRADWPILRDILEQALKNLTSAELDTILDKWTRALPETTSQTLRLSEPEKAWLAANPTIRVALDPHWAPIEYREANGSYAGISLDYLAKLSELLGVTFEPVADLTWDQAVDAVRNGTADMFASVAKTRQRETFARFTRPYLEIPILIFGRKDVAYVGTLDNLAGKRVAVAQGYAIQQWLEDDYPDIELVGVEGPAEGLRSLSSGKVTAFVGNAAAANYYLEKNQLDDVRVVGNTPYANRQAMAARQDIPILAQILQKGLDAITKPQHQAIYDRWMSIRFEPRIDYRLLWTVASAAILVLLLFAYWNRRLFNEVGRRREVEDQLRASQQQLEQRVVQRTADLQETQHRYRATFEQAAVGIARVQPDGKWLEVNDKLCSILGYTRDELLQTDFQVLTYPEDLEADLHLVEETLAGKRDTYTTEKRYITKTGNLLWAMLTVALVRHPNGEPNYFISVVEDISERKRIEDTLARFFDQPVNLHLIASLDGDIKQLNDTWQHTLGYRPDDLVGTNFLDLVHPDDRPATLAEMANLEQGKTVFEFENRFCDNDGNYRLVAWSASASTSENLIFAVGFDITEKRKAEEKLSEAAAVFGNTAEGVVITDSGGLIVDVNDAFTSITGYQRDEVIGRSTNLLNSGRHDEDFYRNMWDSLDHSGGWRGEIWNKRKDGSIYPELLTISRVSGEHGKSSGFVGVFADITALKATEEQLTHLAHHDSLTGLPNRLLLNARLDQSILHAERNHNSLAVVFIDLDRFKNINDSLGHPAGDLVLQELANRLTRLTRRDDTIARISGDEFVVLLETVETTENAIHAVEKLMSAFAEPFSIHGNAVRMTASMGLSLYPQDGSDSETMLRNADAAMYRAKEDGRNTYHFYTAELTTVAFEHMFLESALRNALENDEFRLVYQPQFHLASERLTGIEALIRWEHPQQGTISPGRFIPIAEQSGLIRDIGRWVLVTACRQARQWSDRGLDYGRIGVNVAGPQIQQAGFFDVVSDALNASELPAKQLELEITEGFVMHRTSTSVDQLSRLRQLGVEIAIDDFGTGYSSLSYLKQLPIDKLKIDQAFVRDIPQDPDDMAIAEAVIAMGQALRLRVIAEGVETLEQAAFLREKGCAFAQGFFFSKPLPEAEMTALLEKQTQKAPLRSV